MNPRIASSLFLLSLGCSDGLEVYALTGQAYNRTDECLEGDAVIDVIEGTASGTCEGVKCIRSEETGDIYITTFCEVPDLYEDLTDAETGLCPRALDLYELGEDGLCPSSSSE